MNIIKPTFDWLGGKEPDGEEILERIAKAGRTAYRSDKTDGNDKFVRMLIKFGHESVLEHASVSVVLRVDRGITHEIVRHRIASYTQESTRYCNYTGDKFGNEITYISLMGGMEKSDKCLKIKNADISTFYRIYDEWIAACEDAERHYNNMIELGAPPEIARSVLNTSTAAQIVVTFNMREWRHFFKLRTAPDAHPQMREITEKMLEDFKQVIPVIFEDIII